MKWISLGQLYKKKLKKFKNRPGTTLLKKISQKSIWDNFIYIKKFNLLVYPYFKICNNKKGTMRHKFL